MDDKLVRLSDVAAIIDDHLSGFSIDGNNPVQSTYAMAHTHIKELLKFIPAVDAVEVVRCKDCKYNEGKYIKRNGDVILRCWLLEKNFYSDGYCSWGQRREDGDGDD